MNGSFTIPSPEKNLDFKSDVSVDSIAKSFQFLSEHRVSDRGMLTMLENELSYCFKSFSAFTMKSQNNAQYRLIINQFYSLFKKYDGHLDEVLLLEKLIEAGEKLLSIKGFHLLAKNRCFEEARARMEGSSFGSSMRSSLSAFTSELEVSTDNLFQKRQRRTLGNLLSVYFNLKHRIEFGVLISKFLAIVEFDYGLKSLTAINDVRSILSNFKENIQKSFKIDFDNVLWVAAHGIYHYLEISKFVIEQTNSMEVLNDLAWIRPILLEGDLFKSKSSIQFYQCVFQSLFNLNYQLEKFQECHDIVCSALELFLDMKALNLKEADTLRKLDAIIKKFYIMALAFKTSFGFTIPDSLLSRHITINSNINQIVAIDWENSIRELQKDSTLLPCFKYSRKKFPSDLKVADKQCMDDAIKKILQSLPEPLDLQKNPRLIEFQIEQLKKDPQLSIEPQADEPIQTEKNTSLPDKKKGTMIFKKNSNKPIAVKQVVYHQVEKKPKEESEEVKLKKAWLSDTSLNLAQFENEEDKLTFLCRSLENLLPSCQKLLHLPKMEEKKEEMALSLLKISSDLLESFLSSGHPLIDTKLLVKFGRFYYHFHQWKYLNEIFQYMTNIKSFNNSIYWKEMKIRMALANLSNSFQSSRKVIFDSAVTSSEISADLHFSADANYHLAALCTIISQTVDTALNDIFSSNLFLDLALILWSYIEPFFKKIKSGQENIHINLSIIDFAVFAHSLFGRIPYFSDVKAVTIGLELSLKLSLIFESKQQYEKAVGLLSVCEKNIERAREHNLGSCYNGTDGFTADISFLSQSAYSKAGDFVDPFSSLRRDFAAFHLDVHSSLYRCKLKDFRQKEANHILQKQKETFKLNHIHVQLEKANLYSEDIIMSNCGNDPTRRAIFLMAIFSVETLRAEEKRRLLEKIRDYLLEAKAIEESYLMQNHQNLAPKIVKRTGNVVAITVPKAGLEHKKYFSIFCTSTEKNASDVIGSSIEHLKVHSELIILHNLKRNYSFDIYYLTSDENGTPVRSPCTFLIASLPLHLPLCWTYYSEICLFHQNFELASFSKKILLSHLVQEQKDVSQIVENYNQDFFILKEQSISMCKSYISGFVQMIFSQADYEKKVYFESTSRKNTITTQLLRFKICIDFLLASQCAKRCSLQKLELLSVIKAYQECIPFLEHNLYSDILVKILLQCHNVIISNGSEFENNRGKGVAEFLVPVTFHLIDQLLKNENDNHALVAKIYQETTSLINISTSSVDTKIYLSGAIELNLIGYNFKIPLLKSKKGSSHYLADHGFHGILAVSKNVRAGLQVRKIFDIFYEQLDVSMIKYKIQAGNNEAAKKISPKRVLDSITSLKDIYCLFLLCGPEGVIQELARFKKNPRYTEIISEIIQWCFEKDLYDAAVRFSYDLEDWIDKRNQSILHMQELVDDSAHDRKEIVVKRKRHHLFTVSQKKIELVKQLIAEKQKLEKDVKKGRQFKERPKVLTRPKSASGLSASSIQSLTNEPISSKNENGTTTPRSHSPGPHELDAKKSKQKRAINRFNYFNALPYHEKERKEKAFKVLDNVLSAFWKKTRLRRRLRAVLDYDSSWRANALNIRGKSLIQQIKKDGKSSNIFESREQLNTEQYEFRKSGALILRLFSPCDLSTINFELFQAQNQLYIDALQSLVQSTVLAHRAQEYMKALKFAKTYWNAVRMFLQNGKLDSEFWRLTLWKGFLVVGEVLQGILQHVKIFKSENSDSFSKNDDISLQGLTKAILPIENVHDLYGGEFYASWVDKYHLKQLQQIDLYFCGEFLVFSIEILNAAGLPFRVAHFAKQVQSLFDDAHGSIIAPILKLNSEKNNNEIHPNAVAGVSTALQFRTTARYYVSLALYNRTKEKKMQILIQSAELNYEEAIKIAMQDKKTNVISLLCVEYGDFLFVVKKITKATVFWEKGMNSFFKNEKAIQSIRHIFPIDFTRSFSITDCEKFIQIAGGTYDALLIANTLTKIARFVYTRNHDAQSDLIWIASHLIISVLRSFITQPSNYFGFSYISCHTLVQNCTFFNDKLLLDTLQFAESLVYLSKELISYGFACVSFPLISFAESIACLRLDSIFFSTQISLLKCNAFAHLGMINNSFTIIQNIARIKSKSEDDITEAIFDSSHKPFTFKQLQAVKSLLSFNLNERVCSIFPSYFPADYELCKLETFLMIFNWTDLFEQNTNLDTRNEINHCTEASCEALEILKVHCFKLIGVLQLSIKSQGELALFNEKDLRGAKEWELHIILQSQLIRLCDILSKVFFNRKLFHDSLHWSLSVRKYIAKFKPQQHLYQGITAKLGRKFLMSNREIISNSYIATGKYSMAFKIIDETTTLYEKWKSLYSAGASSLLKFKSLDINEGEGFEQRIQPVKEQLLRIAERLADHPYGISLLSQIYDVLIEEMDICFPEKAGLSNQNNDWKVLFEFSEKSLKYGKIYNEIYQIREESLMKFGKEFSTRKIRHQRLIIATQFASRKNLAELSQLIDDSYIMNKSYCRLIFYVTATSLLQNKSEEVSGFLRSFLNSYLNYSLGVEFVNQNLLQRIYMTLLGLNIQSDIKAGFDYLRKAYYSSRLKPFTISDKAVIEKIPIDILVDLQQSKGSPKLGEVDPLTVKETDINHKNSILTNGVSIETVNSHIASLEKEIASSALSPFGLRYNYLLNHWRNLYQIEGLVSSNSTHYIQDSLSSPKEQEKRQIVLIGWLNGTIDKSDQVQSSTIEYLEELSVRFLKSESSIVEHPTFRSSRSNIVKPKGNVKYYTMVINSRLKNNIKIEKSQPVLPAEPVEAIRPKSGKKRPGSSKLNQTHNIKAQNGSDSASNVSATHSSTIDHQTVSKVTELQTIKHIPETALNLLRKLTKKMVIALANFDVAEDESYKQEAEELWGIILSIFRKIMGNLDQHETNNPALSSRYGILLEKLIDPFQVSGWLEKTSSSANLSASETSSLDKDGEFFRWLIGMIGK